MTIRQLRIALYQPDIAGNTGTIIRMAACLGLGVHIVEPAGFDSSARNLKRAGMDYLELASVTRHVDFAAFEDWRKGEARRLVLLTTKAEMSYTDFSFRKDDVLLFGRELSGVPEHIHAMADRRVTIPQISGRSLNLAVSASMAAGEAVRQTLPQAGEAIDTEMQLRTAVMTGTFDDAIRILELLKGNGYSAEQVYRMLNGWLLEVAQADDRLRNVMDIVSGFCSPQNNIWG